MTPNYKAIGEWLVNGNTGLSSESLAGYLLGAKEGFTTPSDPSDFGRCLHFVEECSSLEEIKGIADLDPAWRPVIDNWESWKEMYKSECHTGVCYKLFNEMKNAGL